MSITTDDYIVVRVQGRSDTGGDPDVQANKWMKNWGLAPENGSLHNGALPTPQYKGKLEFRTWRDDGQLRGDFMIVNGQTEGRLLCGDIIGDDVRPGSTYKIFRMRTRDAEFSFECKPKRAPVTSAQVQVSILKPTLPITPVMAKQNVPIVPAPVTGISTTLPTSATAAGVKPVVPTPLIVKIPIGLIRRNDEQPRKRFNRHELQQLAKSMQQDGQNDPIEVLQIADEPKPLYELIKGERRLKAATLNNWATLDAIVKTREQVPTKQAQNRRCFIADFHHSTYSEFETAINLIAEFNSGTSEEALAAMCGKKVLWVKKYLELRHLQPELFKSMDPDLPRDEQLSISIARVLAKAPPQDQIGFYTQVRKVKGATMRILAAKQLVEGVTPRAGRKRSMKPAVGARIVSTGVARIQSQMITFDGYEPAVYDSLGKFRSSEVPQLLNSLDEVIRHLHSVRDKIAQAAQKYPQKMM